MQKYRKSEKQKFSIIYNKYEDIGRYLYLFLLASGEIYHENPEKKGGMRWNGKSSREHSNTASDTRRKEIKWNGLLLQS